MGLRIKRNDKELSKRLRKDMVQQAALVWNASHGHAAGDIAGLFEEKLDESRRRLQGDQGAFQALQSLRKSLDPELYADHIFEIEKVLDLLAKP